MSDQEATLDTVRREVRDTALKEIDGWFEQACAVFDADEGDFRRYSHLDRNEVRQAVFDTLVAIQHEIATASEVPE